MWRRWLWIGGVLSGCTFTPNAGQGPVDAIGAGGERLPVDGRVTGSDADPPPPIDAQPDAALPALPCPATYTLTDSNHAGSQYRIVTASATWSAAEATCEADEIGGVTGPAHLIVMDDAAEAAFAWAQTTSDQWVGHSDRRTENTWLPVTDQPNVFTGTASGNNNGRDCLIISGAMSATSADTCMNGHPYVCECDGRRADPNSF